MILRSMNKFMAPYKPRGKCCEIYHAAKRRLINHDIYLQVTPDSHVILCRIFSSFPSAYEPRKVEKDRYQWWKSHEHFLSEGNDKEAFRLMLPPPNITGTLHLGHALVCTVQDVLIRWRAMLRQPAYWIPGIDHAGIATQVVVEKKLWQEKKLSRHEIGREKFIDAVYEWKKDKEVIIYHQLEKLGVAVDWKKMFFTLDPERSVAVTEAFIRLYESGKIYRSNSLVNWSTVIQSAISDIEVDLKDVNGSTYLDIPGYQTPVEFGVLVTFACKIHGMDEEILVATTRLETMTGDVAIAVNPKDERYTHLHGRMVVHPIRNCLVPIICDDFVDPNFGTGAVKITPAHNKVDYLVGKSHGLEMIQAIDDEGKMTKACCQLYGMKRFDARKKIMEELEQKGLLRRKEDHSMQIPFCSRSGDVVELLLKPQWFLSCDDMAKLAASLVREEKLKIYPPSFQKIWLNWLENSRDWCLSRQLWWGHQIPMYKCHKKGVPDSLLWIAAHNASEAKQKASQKLGVSGDLLECHQDEDVLDTWFSSALLPFSSLGWPNNLGKLEGNCPLSAMVTGNDILFFWVARMVMLGHELTGKLPFEKIILTGIICDAEGRKMSKSLGNVVHPEDIINGASLEKLNEQVEQSFQSGYLSSAEVKKSIKGQKALFPKGIPECGVDALRFTLCSHNISSQFINFNVNECLTNRHFCNKVWQAYKYVLLCHQKFLPSMPFMFSDEKISVDGLGLMDQWILSRFYHALSDIVRGLENVDLHLCTAAIKNFIYYEFCDVYLETTKRVLKYAEGKGDLTESTSKAIEATLRTLRLCLSSSIQCFAPFMPFIAEELYHQISMLKSTEHEVPESIFLTGFPSIEKWKHLQNEQLEENVKLMMEIILALRRLKVENGIKMKDYSRCHVQLSSIDEVKNIEPLVKEIQSLANCNDVSLGTDEGNFSEGRDSIALGSCVVHLLLPDATIQPKSFLNENKMEKYHKLNKQLQKMMKTMESPSYKTQVPATIQKTHLEKVTKLQDKIKRLKAT
ncbi:valine--tRNA ligase-like [Ischnura elegans]|uniref:valine--tRNA ligase-like n=1 Tax=Ischnura elegans TaxID=197161 RepID=UPI001ED86B3F|nr:valine--tRNA ligase-like [Ischnura elegans]